MKLLSCFLIVILYGCSTLPNDTFIMKEVKTFPEERNVLIAVPVIQVEIDIIE